MLSIDNTYTEGELRDYFHRTEKIAIRRAH